MIGGKFVCRMPGYAAQHARTGADLEETSEIGWFGPLNMGGSCKVSVKFEL